MIKIYSATKTLEEYNLNLCYTKNKQEADLVILGGKSINLDEFPNLKGIFKTGVGTDNLPFEQAAIRNIKIQLPSENTKSIIYDETASFSCFLILKSIYKGQGVFYLWNKKNRNSIKNKTLLVIGLGQIGKRVVERMKSYMDIITYDLVFNKEVELNDYIKIADCITIHIPLNSNTINLFDKNKLSLIKNRGILINTSRGAIVNEEALFNELSSKRIFAAFDVFWDEPYIGILKDLPETHFIKTPHIASNCIEFLEGLANDFFIFHNEFHN